MGYWASRIDDLCRVCKLCRVGMLCRFCEFCWVCTLCRVDARALRVVTTDGQAQLDASCP
jgi:hypothetical protein